MSITFYKLLHLFGVFLVLMSLGGYCLHRINGGERPNNVARKGFAIAHGIGLVLVAIAGFGMLARLGITGGLPVWVWLKLIIWLILGAMPVLIYRSSSNSWLGWYAVLCLSIGAAWLGLVRPW